MVLQTDWLKKLSSQASFGLYGSGAFLVFIFILNLSHVGSFRNGFEFWKQAEKNSPRSSLAKLNYGARLIERGDLGEAFKVLLEGMKINPLEPKLHNNIGVIFARTGKLDQAEKEFRKEIEMNPEYSDAYFNLGILYGEKGEWPRMEEMWRKTLEIDPHNERAQRFLTDDLSKRRSTPVGPRP
jgi:protein O-mannosyl-transferase